MQENWEIKFEDKEPIYLNIGQYTSIYDEHETQEELLLNQIYQYFQKRNSKNSGITIKKFDSGEMISSSTYLAFLYDNYLLDLEHKLASTSLLSKKVLREINNNLEINSYLNSVNVLFEDFLNNMDMNIPLFYKDLDSKGLLRQLEFDTKNHTVKFNRIMDVLPALIEEMKSQANGEVLLIYLYPEAGLSAKEQLTFKNLLLQLPVSILVLTDSSYFLSEKFESSNLIMNHEQALNDEFLNALYWNCPMNLDRSILKDSFYKVFKQYVGFLQMNPTISNHCLCDIILFDPIDIYCLVYFLEYHKFSFNLDLEYSRVPNILTNYLKSL